MLCLSMELLFQVCSLVADHLPLPWRSLSPCMLASACVFGTIAQPNPSYERVDQQRRHAEEEWKAAQAAEAAAQAERERAAQEEQDAAAAVAAEAKRAAAAAEVCRESVLRLQSRFHSTCACLRCCCTSAAATYAHEDTTTMLHAADMSASACRQRRRGRQSWRASLQPWMRQWNAQLRCGWRRRSKRCRRRAPRSWSRCARSWTR